ncbi:MAG: hypothetical protein EA363_02300 [Balneolaceae bacterium]|nr:MAG: hypothetical protein EA363_02300 [Balneolaceae bacterium]
MLKHQIKSSIFVCLLATLVTFPGNAEAQSEITVETLRELAEGRSLVRAIREVETAGSPYLFEDFKAGHITLSNGVNSERLMMNYNIHKERVEVIQGDFALSIMSDRLAGFEFTDMESRYLFRNGYESSRLSPDDFVRVLADGEITALLKYNVSLQQDVPTYSVATQQDRYTKSQRLFIKKDGDIQRVRRMNERSILRSLDHFQDEMRDFVRQEQLDLSSINHLERFFRHYNTLFEE